MFLKIMDGDDINPETEGKGFVIISNIIEARYRYVRRKPEREGDPVPEPRFFVDVVYGTPNRGLTTETFSIHGTAFLMNEYGRTIQTYYAKQQD